MLSRHAAVQTTVSGKSIPEVSLDFVDPPLDIGAL
jgi:hypothetical protein